MPLAVVLPMGSYPYGRRRCPRWVDERHCPQAAAPTSVVPAGASLAGGHCLCPQVAPLWVLTPRGLAVDERHPLRAYRVRLPLLAALDTCGRPYRGLAMADHPFPCCLCFKIQSM
ncbi:hypothetical protein GW17_00046230 [Ensete ventricosum]|nr:hypothetical protein GW17_00046230 [Ensete ventricosum]